jgi:hypothetical protein
LPEYLSFTRVIEFEFGLNLVFELRHNSRSNSLSLFPTKGPLNQIDFEKMSTDRNIALTGAYPLKEPSTNST